MSVTSIKSMTALIKSQVKEMDVLEGFTNETEVQEVIDLLEEHDYCAPSVVYHQDAFEIVSGSQFKEYYGDISDLDISNCKTSLEALEVEANFILENAYQGIRDEVIAEYLEHA